MQTNDPPVAPTGKVNRAGTGAIVMMSFDKANGVRCKLSVCPSRNLGFRQSEVESSSDELEDTSEVVQHW